MYSARYLTPTINYSLSFVLHFNINKCSSYPYQLFIMRGRGEKVKVARSHVDSASVVVCLHLSWRQSPEPETPRDGKEEKRHRVLLPAQLEESCCRQVRIFVHGRAFVSALALGLPYWNVKMSN